VGADDIGGVSVQSLNRNEWLVTRANRHGRFNGGNLRWRISQMKRNFSISAWVLLGVVALFATILGPHAAIMADDDDVAGKVPLPPLLDWEKQIRKDVDKDEKVKALVGKYKLILLPSRALFAGGDYRGSAYSFVWETADESKHKNNVQLLFHNGGNPKTFDINMGVGQQNLVVDLGKADFEKDPDPTKINIDDPGVHTASTDALARHVYLERVRDDRGQNFYVVFQVIAVDQDSRYMAFIWRKLPGGKVNKN
jgi:hypothetical protein